MIKPLNPPMIEHLHSLALEDLARRRNMSDGTWNNLLGGADSAFIVNYIDDVTKAYRSYQAKNALTYRPQTKPQEGISKAESRNDRPINVQPYKDKPADTYRHKETGTSFLRSDGTVSEKLVAKVPCPCDNSSSPLPSDQGRLYSKERRYLQI